MLGLSAVCGATIASTLFGRFLVCVVVVYLPKSADHLTRYTANRGFKLLRSCWLETRCAMSMLDFMKTNSMCAQSKIMTVTWRSYILSTPHCSKHQYLEVGPFGEID